MGVRLKSADYKDPKWVERHRHMFKMLDRSNNGLITLNELRYKASEEICKKMGATPEQTQRHTDAVCNFFSGAGMRYDYETPWPEYIKGWEDLCEAELDRWGNSESTLIYEWGKALFDMIDKDDSGGITPEEWQFYTECAGVITNKEDALETFNVCDRNKDGLITVEEMTRQHIGFWYTAHPDSDGLYGPSVP